MRNSTFKCEKCGDEKIFNLENITCQPICSKCGGLLKRIYKNIKVGEIVSDEMIHIGQQMLYS